jgi:hypothetical protein
MVLCCVLFFFFFCSILLRVCVRYRYDSAPLPMRECEAVLKVEMDAPKTCYRRKKLMEKISKVSLRGREKREKRERADVQSPTVGYDTVGYLPTHKT